MFEKFWPIRTNKKEHFVYPNQIATTTIAKSQLRVVFKVHSTHFTTWLGLCSLTLCLSSGRHRNLVVIIIFYTTSNSFKNHGCNRSTLILWQSFQWRIYIKGLQHLTISEVKNLLTGPLMIEQSGTCCSRRYLPSCRLFFHWQTTWLFHMCKFNKK